MTDYESRSTFFQHMNTPESLRLHAHPRPVLNGLPDMVRRDQLAPGKVGDGARQFEHAMIGPRREVQLLHRGFHELFGRWLDLTKLTYLGWSHFGVAGHFGAAEPLQLSFAGRLHALANGCRVLDLPFLGQFLIIHTGNLNMDSNAVEQRATDAFLVACNGGSRAGTFFDGVAELATRAPVQIAVAPGSKENMRIWSSAHCSRCENFPSLKSLAQEKMWSFHLR